MSLDEKKEIEPLKIIDTTEKAEVEMDNNKKGDTFFKDLFSYLLIIVIAFLFAQVIHRFLFTPVIVEGDSMKTTIYDKDYIFLSRVSKISRYDIIVFDVPHSKEPYIKRVIGLPGDKVEMVNYKLYINDKLVDETYLNPDPKYTGVEKANGNLVSFDLEGICNIKGTDCSVDGETVIPKGYYLVLGDNRNNSIDSRVLGLISEEDVLGEALFVLYPFDRFGKTFK